METASAIRMLWLVIVSKDTRFGPDALKNFK